MITVRIPKATLNGFPGDIHQALHTLGALKRAGIPVTGSLLPTGVENGALNMVDDPGCPDVVWTWEGELYEDMA